MVGSRGGEGRRRGGWLGGEEGGGIRQRGDAVGRCKWGPPGGGSVTVWQTNWSDTDFCELVAAVTQSSYL